MTKLTLIAAAMAGALLATSGTALAQAYPNKPVRIVVPYPAGGNTDGIARITADVMTRQLGQQFVVENRAGAGGQIASEFVKGQPADGYTMMMSALGVFAVVPHLQKVAFDPVKDFAPVSIIGINSFVLAVHPSMGVKSVKELVDLAKKNPGKFSYASGGNGSISHLSGAMFVSRAGLDMVHVPYKGGGPAIADLVAGQVNVYFGNFAEVVPQARGGRVVMLGVSSPGRDKQLPEMPPIADTYPNFRTVTWNGLVAPAGTPREAIDRVSSEANKAAKDPATAERFLKIGVEPWGSTPEEFADSIRKDFEQYRDVIRSANIKAG